MKINWGWRIFITYAIFITFVLSVLYFSTTLNNDKVADNYYDAEIKYQDYIDKLERTKTLEIKPIIIQNADYLIIQFDSLKNNESIIGEISLQKPENKKNDKSIKLNLDSNNQHKILMSVLKKGKWNLELRWSENDNSYLINKIIWVN